MPAAWSAICIPLSLSLLPASLSLSCTFLLYLSHLIQFSLEQGDLAVLGESDVQPGRDGVDEVHTPGGGVPDELRELVGFLQRVELPPAGPVLVVVLGGVEVGVHGPA